MGRKQETVRVSFRVSTLSRKHFLARGEISLAERIITRDYFGLISVNCVNSHFLNGRFRWQRGISLERVLRFDSWRANGTTCW